MSLARLLKERKELAANGGSGNASSTAAMVASPTLSPALKRIRADLDSLGSTQSRVTVTPSDPYRIEIAVRPKSGIWEGGTFNFALLFSDEFPYEGPKVRYTGPFRVFHPNIEGDDRMTEWGVCLGLQTEWRATYSIKDLVTGLELLFSNPTYDDPLPGVASEAAQVLKDYPEEFRRRARNWMSGHYI